VSYAHVGDAALNAVLSRLPGIYRAATANAEELIGQFLKPRMSRLRPRDNEKATAYRLRVTQAFVGREWASLRKRIAQGFTDAHMAAGDTINGALTAAFAAGLSEAAYTIARNGVEMWPITAAIVAKLVTDGVITLNECKLNRNKSIKYNEERVDSAVHAEVFSGTAVEKLPKAIAQRIANGRKNDVISVARATVYGASDTGAYYAGLEAAHIGIETEKTWLSIMDMRVRTSHKNLHGTTIPINERFQGYYGTLRYPHDPTAPPQETMRCRCRMVVHVKGKPPGEYSRELLPSQTAAYKKWRDAQIRKAGSELELMKKHKRLLGR